MSWDNCKPIKKFGKDFTLYLEENDFDIGDCLYLVYSDWNSYIDCIHEDLWEYRNNDETWNEEKLNEWFKDFLEKRINEEKKSIIYFESKIKEYEKKLTQKKWWIEFLENYDA
jgi:hypothetical protein